MRPTRIMSLSMTAFLAAVYVMFAGIASAATTILPPAVTCFTGLNGVPLVVGSVNMFFPNTTTPKATWVDAQQSALNTQPIQLDGNGCAIIYGVGSYTQQVYDGPVVAGATSGTQIWNKITTDTSAFNSTFWASTAGGTPNVITIVDTGFNGTDGTIVNFTALSTNTGPATLNPSGSGAIPILKDTTGGPVSLSGNEIIATNPISALYRASDNAFHLLNAAIASASGATAPLCGATGLKITNDTSTPNTIINLTARQIVMQTASGITINRSNVSLTAINISTGNATATANGMDGEAVGTNAWLDIFAIDNGAAPAGLVSLAAGNGLSPTMPSGYTYKCYLGAMRVGAGGLLRRTRQLGAKTSYFVALGATGGPVTPLLASGVAGTFSLTGPSWVSVSVSSAVPPSASHIYISFNNAVQAAATANVEVAPSTNWLGPQANFALTTGTPTFMFLNNGTGQVQSAEILLEGATIVWASDAAGGGVFALGWTDQVNAN